MSPTNVTAIATKAKRLKSTRQSLLQPAQPQQTYSVPYSYIPRKNQPFTNYNCNHYAIACGTLAQTMTALLHCLTALTAVQSDNDCTAE